MTDDLTIAVAHYPEGAGHATRMLAVADALVEAGAEVELAGGGAGTQFVALNGYDEFEPTTVDYIDTYQGGSLRSVLSESVPATAERVTDYVEWLRSLDPDALVTDDMFAAIAATRTDIPLYVLKHDLPALYRDRIERTGAAFHTEFQRSAAREFFYPAVWPTVEGEPAFTETEAGTGTEDGGEGEDETENGESADVTRIPPVALEGDETASPDEESAPDVVVVPSHYSELGRVADNLARQGYDVIDVGSDEWDPVASLLPYLRAADVVVCSGYSTVMDAAVAGTPCVVHPATDEQEAVANRLEDADVTGFAVAETPIDVLDAVASPPDTPSFENGATDVAAAVIDDLWDGTMASPGKDGAVGSSGANDTGTTTDSDATLADRAVAGGVALGTATRATALRTRRYAGVGKEYASTGAVIAYRYARWAGRSAVRYATVAAVTLADWTRRTARWTRTTAHRCRRYATAITALSTATLVVTGVGLRGTGNRIARGTVTATSTLRSVASTGLEQAATGCERLADGLQRVAAGCRAGADALGSPGNRLAGLGRRLRETARSSE